MSHLPARSHLRPYRRVVLALATATATATAAACGWSAPVAPDDQAQLAAGARLADSLATAARWDDAGVVALGYFERLRLGLGSPFRLAEQAAGDVRLGAVLGRRVAWGVLAGTLRGQAFAIDSAALGEVPDALAPGGNPNGGWHRALIDSAVRAAPTARTGEEAVRVTYALARSEGLVTGRVAQAAVHAAALARDRRLAMDDVRALLAASRSPAEHGAANTDALQLLRDWRLARRFRSEAALLSDPLTPDAPAAVQAAERLLERMRREGVVVRAVQADSLGLAPRTDPTLAPLGAVAASVSRAGAAATALAWQNADSSSHPRPGPSILATPAPVVVQYNTSIGATPAARRDEGTLGAIPLAAARRLTSLPSARAAYPTAAVVVTLGGFHRTLAADTLATQTLPPGLLGGSKPADGADATDRRVRARFAARAHTEELLVAEWAVARAALTPGSLARREMAGLVQAAAVALRPWAQAPAVGVAVGAATGAGAAAGGASAEVDALRLRDGYRAIAFDAGTPPAWRAAAARQLGDAVADLRAAFPDLTLDGLAVRVGESPRRDLALALHEPRSRTVYLPPGTGAGTVAHELVHDLDWQAARTRLAVQGGYGTDRLARSGSGELAQAVRGLAGARLGGRGPLALGATAPGTMAVDADRPAERLARGADFFVAAALARDGRTNGVLSTVQDPMLTGYAGVVAPEPGDGSAEALMEVLGAVTRVPPSTRAWYLARFGSAGVRTPLGVAQFALAALPGWEAERTLRFAGVPGGLAVATAGSVQSCAGVGGGRGAAWQSRLVWLAADARARGLIRRRAAHAAAVGGAWWGWAARGLLGGPWSAGSAEESVARMRDAIVRAATAEARKASGGCGVLDAPG